jgi:hypothetical protein
VPCSLFFIYLEISLIEHVILRAEQNTVVTEYINFSFVCLNSKNMPLVHKFFICINGPIIYNQFN